MRGFRSGHITLAVIGLLVQDPRQVFNLIDADSFVWVCLENRFQSLLSLLAQMIRFLVFP